MHCQTSNQGDQEKIIIQQRQIACYYIGWRRMLLCQSLSVLHGSIYAMPEIEIGFVRRCGYGCATSVGSRISAARLGCTARYGRISSSWLPG